MQNEHYWFQWERQATVHPIIMCMEAWMEPMKKEYGKPWPTAVIIYNKDLVGWYDPWHELLDYGQYAIDIFVQKDKRDELEKEINSQAKALEGMFIRLDHENLSKLSDNKLLATYEELYKKWIRWFVPGGLVEPIGHQGEKLLQKLLDGKVDTTKAISIITTTARESFSKRELKELLEIVLAKQRGQNVIPLLEAHARKYYWLHNSYFSTEVLGTDFFANELKLAETKYPDPAKQLKAMEEDTVIAKKEKHNLFAKLNFNEKERSLVELLDLFAWYQDYRKEYTMRMLHYLDLVLKEIGKHKGLTLQEMKYTVPSEIKTVVEGTFDKTIAKERMTRCLFYWDAKTEKFTHGTGEFSLEKEKEIFHSIKHDNEIVEVSGMVASKGFVRGIARVTMSARDAKEIQKGEILITSMTTPDFVTAMKKAVAVVTNEGGILSHAAVISREFGIPCIVGTRIATKVFKTGDLIEVDGELGVVRKIKGERSPE